MDIFDRNIRNDNNNWLNNIFNKEKYDDFINNASAFFLLYFHFDIRDYHRF